MPERVLRTALLLLATVGGFAPLALHRARPGDALAGLLLLLLAAAQSLRAESTPEELDSPAARRARRFAPLAVGLLLVGLVVFPRFDAAGTFLVLLFFADLPLVAFWHVPAVRAVSLVVVSVAALGAVMLVPGDAAAPCLLPVALAWTFVPALDRLAAVRGRLDPRPPARLAETARSAGAVLAVGLALFLAGLWLLPASTRRWTAVSILSTATTRAEPPAPPELPFGRLLALLGAAAVTLLAWNAYASRLGARRRAPEQGLAMAAGAARPLDPEEVARAVAAWPAGPRRAVVEAYLGHVLAIEAKGARRAPGATPRALARLLAGRLSLGAATAAERLADRFGRARWDPAPVAVEEPGAARAEAARVEGDI